jgi:hypothetical protein
VKLHLLCATNRVPLSYELTPANVAEVGLTEELLADAQLFEGEPLARRLLGDLAYRSRQLKGSLGKRGILLVTERAKQRGFRQQVEIALASLKQVFRLGETLATTLTGLATRIAAKMTAYTYAFLANRILGRPQGRIKELWAWVPSQHSSSGQAQAFRLVLLDLFQLFCVKHVPYGRCADRFRPVNLRC